MESTHHVTVRLAREFEFVAEFDDVPGAPSVIFDEPPPLGGGRAPSAAAMLGAAVGNCLAASLTFCLRRAHVEVVHLTANVATHVIRTDTGRFRIGGIDVELVPELETVVPAIDRCEALFEDFCTVTASVRNGIPVHVRVKSQQAG